jgi:transcriptional regulator with XRE-family HTH domain
LHIVQRRVKTIIAHSAIAHCATENEGAAMHLARFRQLKNLSLVDLGEMVGLDASTVHRAEKMQKSAKLSTYIACAEALGVTLADIFAEDMTPTERAVLEAFRRLPEEQHARVLGLLELAATQPR